MHSHASDEKEAVESGCLWNRHRISNRHHWTLYRCGENNTWCYEKKFQLYLIENEYLLFKSTQQNDPSNKRRLMTSIHSEENLIICESRTWNCSKMFVCFCSTKCFAQHLIFENSLPITHRIDSYGCSCSRIPCTQRSDTRPETNVY